MTGSRLAFLRERDLRDQDLLKDVCMVPGWYLSNLAIHEVAEGCAQNTTWYFTLIFGEGVCVRDSCDCGV